MNPPLSSFGSAPLFFGALFLPGVQSIFSCAVPKAKIAEAIKAPAKEIAVIISGFGYDSVQFTHGSTNSCYYLVMKNMTSLHF